MGTRTSRETKDAEEFSFLIPAVFTRPNRGSPASVAWLEIVDGKINWKLVPLL